MKQLSWKEIAEFVGIAGVIASLAIVALEIRENTSAVRSATIHAIASESYGAAMRIVENSELRSAYWAAFDGDLSEEQHRLLTVFAIGVMRIQVNRYEQIKLGYLDIETALRIGGRSNFYKTDFFREFWARTKEDYSSDFQEYMSLYNVLE